MGSQPTTEQKTEPLKKSEIEQKTQLRNSLETQKKSNDSQNLSNALLTEALIYVLLIEELTNALTEQPRIDSQQRNNLTPEQRIGDSGHPSNNAATGQEKLYDPKDTTLDFVDGDDDMDFECNDFKSRRAKMSCGHTVTPMSLTIYCKTLLDQGECKFVCGIPDCNVEWPYEEVRKMALLTSEEMHYFEKKMSAYAARNYYDVKSCPGCKSAAVRSDLNNLQVYCTKCTSEKKRVYKFCWQCLQEWKGPAPRSDRCENDGCQSPLEILRTCPEIRFNIVVGVTGCPSTRACPTCGLLAEHDKTMCKNVICTRCKVEFCFVCLKHTDVCQRLKSNSNYKLCSTGVAPRQTSIPVWRRK